MMILNVMLFTYILGFLVAMVRGRKPSNILCCGIFGISCAEGKKPNIKNLIIQGLYNRTRGTDSCGYYYNGNIVKGINKEADFKDFIIKNKLKPGELPYDVVMCHTRKATYGSHTEENAHPHQVGNLVQTHNGTIKNIWTLCNNHGISHTTIHVDSIGLAHIIQKDGFEVLNEYEGYAALTMVFMDDPASLYLYHGASKETEDGKLFEERPLFYLQTADGLYYSSLQESLAVINNTKNEIKILPHNRVFRIQQGKIIEEVYKVERSENNVSKVYKYNKTTYNSEDSITDYRNKNGKRVFGPAVQQTGLPFKEDTIKLMDNKVRSSILKETAPPEKPVVYKKSQVYYRYGRHHHTGYVSTSTHNWVEGEILLNGEYIIDRDGTILTDPSDSNRTSETFYFVRGVLLRDEKAYKDCLQNHRAWCDLRYNTALALSKWSRYPITSYFDEGSMVTREFRNAWWLDGKKYEGEITLKFTKRKYKIRSGFLDCINHEKEEGSAFKLGEVDSDKSVHLEVPTVDLVLPFIKRVQSEYDGIAEVIQEWADKIITKEDIELIPECFYLFIEKYLSEANPLFNELDLFNEVVSMTQNLIDTKGTLLEKLKDNFEKDDYISGATLEELFKDETPLEIINMPNRFKVVQFELIEFPSKPTSDVQLSDSVVSSTGDVCTAPDPKQKKTETTVSTQLAVIKHSVDGLSEEKRKEIEKEERLKKKLAFFAERVEAIADELQVLDSDTSQNLAFCVYTFTGNCDKVNKGQPIK